MHWAIFVPQPCVGRLRIESNGIVILNGYYHTREYRNSLINKAISDYAQVEIYLSPDEQPEKRFDTDVEWRGVSNIFYTDHNTNHILVNITANGKHVGL